MQYSVVGCSRPGVEVRRSIQYGISRITAFAGLQLIPRIGVMLCFYQQLLAINVGKQSKRLHGCRPPKSRIIILASMETMPALSVAELIVQPVEREFRRLVLRSSNITERHIMGYTLTDGECVVRGTAFLTRYSSGDCIVPATHQDGWAYVVGKYETVEQARDVVKEINTEAASGYLHLKLTRLGQRTGRLPTTCLRMQFRAVRFAQSAREPFCSDPNRSR